MPEIDSLEMAARDFQRDADLDFVDPKRLSAVIDALQGELCKVLARGVRRGDHMLTQLSPTTWAARMCSTSTTSASDRLCVGAQLEAMPKVAEALRSGQIGYQATAVICHLQSRVDEIPADIGEELWIENACKFSLKDLRDLAAHTWHAVAPDSFRAAAEEIYERRSLFISESCDMYRLDGWLDPEGGAALKTVIEALAKPLGEADRRTPRQMRADALMEMVHHAMEQGTMPRRNRVRPHITVHTTMEGLKGELGAAASELQGGWRSRAEPSSAWPAMGR